MKKKIVTSPSTLKAALKLEPIAYLTTNGIEVILRRPSVLDLVTAIEISKANTDTPHIFQAWLVQNHLYDGDTQVFTSTEEVLECDNGLIQELSGEIDKLYGEGKN